MNSCARSLFVVTGNVWTPRFCSRGASGMPGAGSLVVAGRLVVVLVVRRRGVCASARRAELRGQRAGGEADGDDKQALHVS